MINMWVEKKYGNQVIKQNVTPSQLLAQYIILGADLRELSENLDSSDARSLLDEIIEHHESIMTDEPL